MDKNEPQKSTSLEFQFDIKVIGYRPINLKYFIEFLEKMNDSQDLMCESSSPDIDRLSFTFGEMSVFDLDNKSQVAIDENVSWGHFLRKQPRFARINLLTVQI